MVWKAPIFTFKYVHFSRSLDLFHFYIRRLSELLLGGPRSTPSIRYRSITEVHADWAGKGIDFFTWR